LNNWRAVGYIFLGWGSVFLIYALIAFLGMMSLSPTFLNFAPIALAANAQWFILAALFYVVGVVGYYAGQEKVAASTPVKQKRQSASSKIDRAWSVVIGASTALAVIALQYFAGLIGQSDAEVAMPLTISIVAGLIIGIAVYLAITYLD